MEKTILENESIRVVDTGKEYDFIAYVENKTDRPLAIVLDDGAVEEKTSEFVDGEWEVFDKSEYSDEDSLNEAFNEYISCFDYMPENFVVKGKDWIGILADPEGRITVELLKEGKFTLEDELPVD